MWGKRWAKPIGIPAGPTEVWPVFLRRGQSLEEAGKEALRTREPALDPPIPYFGYAGCKRYLDTWAIKEPAIPFFGYAGGARYPATLAPGDSPAGR